MELQTGTVNFQGATLGTRDARCGLSQRCPGVWGGGVAEGPNSGVTAPGRSSKLSAWFTSPPGNPGDSMEILHLALSWMTNAGTCGGARRSRPAVQLLCHGRQRPRLRTPHALTQLQSPPQVPREGGGGCYDGHAAECRSWHEGTHRLGGGLGMFWTVE